MVHQGLNDYMPLNVALFQTHVKSQTIKKKKKKE